MGFNKVTNKYEGYIYKIYNDINDKLYIGQTRNTILTRFNQHVTKSKLCADNQAIHRAMNKYGIENFHVEEIESVQKDTKEELINSLNDKEQYYIKKYNSLVDNNGYNIAIGGAKFYLTNCISIIAYNRDGSLFCTSSSVNEMSQKIGCSMSTIIDCCKGKRIPISLDIIFRYEGDDFNKYSIERKIVGKKVYQFDIDGILLATYTSIHEAAKNNALSASSVANAIRTKGLLFNAFWSKENSFDYKGNKWDKSVDQYSKDGVYIKTYRNIAIASNETKIERSIISRTCKGEYGSGGGYVWKYHGEKFSYIPKTTKKKVDMYTSDNVYIKTFNSRAEAAKEIGCYDAQISSCCNGKLKSIKGFIFKNSNLTI